MEEKTARLTIGVLSIFKNNTEITNFKTVCSNSIKKHISDLSVSNFKAALLISEIAAFEKELYIPSVSEKRTSVDNDKQIVSSITSYVNSCVKELTTIISELEDMNMVEDDELSVYNKTNDSKYRGQQDYTPVLLRYFSAKDLISDNSDILKDFGDLRTKILSDRDSERETIVSHFGAVLDLVAKFLDARIKACSTRQSIYDAVNLANICYTHYNWSERSDADAFLSRNFSEIKKDLEALT